MDPFQPASAPWRSGLRGLRAHFRAGLALQVAALALVLAYYHSAAARDSLDRLMDFKLRTGFAFGIVSTGLFGGILPYAYLRHEGLKRAGRPRYSWRQGLGLTAFWAYKGFEVDLFYRILARTIGAGHDPRTILEKLFTDQFVYCPAFAVPVTVAVYQLADAHGRAGGVAADLRAPRWYARRVLPVLISNAGVWIPAVAIIYSLPTPLQLPLQNLVLCFFTLLVAHQMYLEPPAEPGYVRG
ncbi:MAG TPA: hypothetical protein VHC86_13775 [Opitutaceae bacterium]|nr:hypothetical protein [Opitutaceae bacterium]